MPQVTLNLSEEAYAALRDIAMSRGQTLSQVVEASLEVAGILSDQQVAELVGQARSGSSLSEEEALELAVDETRAVRRHRVS